MESTTLDPTAETGPTADQPALLDVGPADAPAFATLISTVISFPMIVIFFTSPKDTISRLNPG